VSDEEVLLAVGDVAGHGLPAASAMAKLRHAITGLAFAQHDPGEILVVLNRLLQRMRPDVIATAVVAHYRSTDRTFTWAHAGHPPILLVRGDTVRPLFHTGMMLGVSQQVTYCCDRVRLEPDDLVVMFTDGLIERPGRDLAEGLDVLCTAIADAVRARPADRLAAVMGVLEPSNPRDDTCSSPGSCRPGPRSPRPRDHVPGRESRRRIRPRSSRTPIGGRTAVPARRTAPAAVASARHVFGRAGPAPARRAPLGHPTPAAFAPPRQVSR